MPLQALQAEPLPQSCNERSHFGCRLRMRQLFGLQQRVHCTKRKKGGLSHL